MLYPFLTSAVNGGEWSASLSDCFTSEERNSGYWVGTRGLSGRSRRKAKSLTETIRIFINRQYTVYYTVKYPTGICLDKNIRTTKRYFQKYTRKPTFHGIILYISIQGLIMSRSQWPRGLRRRSTAARLLRSWVRIPPRTWMFVCCECCVLSGRGLCDELITRPEESYRLWCVVCDL